MKKQLMILFICLGVLGIIGFGYGIKDTFHERLYKIEKPLPYDCDNINTIYLKPSEMSSSGAMANKIHGIAIIPEENMLVAETQLLEECDNIDFSKYIDMGELA